MHIYIRAGSAPAHVMVVNVSLSNESVLIFLFLFLALSPPTLLAYLFELGKLLKERKRKEKNARRLHTCQNGVAMFQTANDAKLIPLLAFLLLLPQMIFRLPQCQRRTMFLLNISVDLSVG